MCCLSGTFLAREDVLSRFTCIRADVIIDSIEVATTLTGKKPLGYRAPMHTIRESTILLLREHNFLYDSSLSHHD